MLEPQENNIGTLARTFLQKLVAIYHDPLYKYLKKNTQLIQTFPGFLLNPESVIVYIGRTHIAIEYVGPETVENLKTPRLMNIKYYDYTSEDCNLLEKIIGFEYDSTYGLDIPLSVDIYENFLLPTNKGWVKLSELKWNLDAQDSIMLMNAPCPKVMSGDFIRIINGMFFDSNSNGLVTRRIKWLDFFPINFTDKGEIFEFNFNLEYMKEFIKKDAYYEFPIPKEFRKIQLPKINKFIEIWGNNNSSELDITSFLANNKFILTMKFGAIDCYDELTCEWQSEKRDNIRPDFFVVQPNGYADIVEFKLPEIKGNAIVGKQNRESLSSTINSYISQTRCYLKYFEDPNNRKWFENKYGFKVYSPKRYLVIGRRSDFSSDVWTEIISDYNKIDILTFDDLIDGVCIQFYKS